MNQAIRDFFERGKSIRHKRQGAFLVVEKDTAILSILEKWIRQISGQAFVKFNSPCLAKGFLEQCRQPIRCVIVNMSLFGQCTSEELLKMIDEKMPQVVCVAYTDESSLAEQLSTRYPRVTVIRSGAGACQLLEALSSEIVGCDTRARAIA